jgi:hypothetical protein
MKHKTRVVTNQTNLGIYVWELLNGDFLADEDLNILSITAMRGDIVAMTAVSNAAKNLGFEGRPVFLEGYRKITDEEFQEQIHRMQEGLIPDPLDIGVYKDSLRYGR